jgi:two-component system sensor histidine kinase/response regulator
LDVRRVFLSTLPAGRGEQQLALAVVLLSGLIFLAAAPFAKEPLARVPAFIPIYQSALAINDLITAVLLFGQFGILRSRALGVLASAYLFTAFMAAFHLLSFPDLFSPSGLLGAGPQTTAWLYMFWHGGFPLLVIVYALLKDETTAASRARGRAGRVVVSSVASVVALACGLTLLATAGQEWLPAIMQGNHYTAAMSIVVTGVWGLSFVALVVLWRRPPHSVLDLWLMVVMCAWIFDIALAVILNAGRFDLGFYAGRIYGLLAASFVLVVLLLENGALYARLAAVHEELEAQNRSLEEIVRQRTERLLQSEKVATMGSLLAGVAHELNNPLAALTGHAQLLRQTAQDPALITRAEKINQAAHRCVRIVRNFLSLARQRPPERSEVRLNKVVEEAVELLAYELKTGGVEIVVDLEEGLPQLWADGHQLHQVLVNLVGNAHHAMRRNPPPRRITIAARHDAPRGRVRLTVTDTGPGIPPEIRAKIFEPFFTTKPAGEGTGLGLSLCRGIIEEHGGTIDVESAPGEGTRFTIQLPVVAAPRGATAGRATDEALPPVSSKRLLVVDDEADIAGVIAEALGHDGHHADVATNGAMALGMLAKRDYDLIVSDTKMPVLDGESLYAEVGRRFPTLHARVIFVTADVLSREKREFLERTGRPFLTKPCDLDELRRLVHRVLAGVASNGAAAT